MSKSGIRMEAIEGVQTVVFQSPYNPDHKLVCIPAEKTLEEWWEIAKTLVYAKRCDYAQFDVYGDYFYLCYVANCFDPLMCIVRADDEREAVDMFVDTFEYARVTQENYGTPEEFERAIEDGVVGVTYGNNYYDAERMQCIQITGPVHITMEV